MSHQSPRIKVFTYIKELDGFVVTAEYREIALDLRLDEWNLVVWIGRLFSLDNDFGEHWFDNWDLREARSERAAELGIELGDLFIVDPDRMQNGQDGPCNTPELRGQFWHEVLDSFQVSLELLFSKARAMNEQTKALLERHPSGSTLKCEYLPEIETRIRAWSRRYRARGG